MYACAVGPEGVCFCVCPVGPEGLASARVALHAASLALRASLLLRRGLACARPSGPPFPPSLVGWEVGRARSLYRAPWLPCAMGRLADGIRMPHAGPKERMRSPDRAHRHKMRTGP